MRKHNRSSYYSLATRVSKIRFLLGGELGNITGKSPVIPKKWLNHSINHKLHSQDNFQNTARNSKRGNSAEVQPLLTSALRPRLYRVGNNYSKESFCLPKIVSNFIALFLITVTILIIQNTTINNVSAASLTLEVPTAISLDITPASGGTFAKSSTSNVSVKTDAPWGYNLTIKGKSADTSLVSGSSKLTSITGNLTEDQFKAGASNTWGYLPSKVDSSANTTFRPGPSTTATTIDKTSAKNDTANNYSIILGAKVDDKVIAGAYTNTFTLTSTANTVSYNITYNLNSGSWSGTSPQIGNTTASTITLDSHTPTKSNYTFQGWCTSSSISNNNTTSTPTCNGTKYSVGATYNLSNGSNTVTMYAMWKQNVTYRSYTIYYQSNIGSPSNMPSTQTGSAASTDSYRITLRSNTPSMTNYSFYGWCTSSSITNNGVYGQYPSCNGTTYSPGNSYTVSSNGATVYLYAMWRKTVQTNGDDCSRSGWSGAAKYYGGYCWMWTDYRINESWSTVNSSCPSGWHLPSKSEFQALLSAIGTGGQLYHEGWSRSYRYYWSSTQYSSGIHYYLYVDSTNANINGGGYDSNTYTAVRCVSS